MHQYTVDINSSPSSKCQHNLLQLPKIRRPKTRHRVPPHRRLKTNHEFQSPTPNTREKEKKRQRTLNPGVPHPGAFPAVMSLNPFPFNVYMSGLRKPRGLFPAAIRASFKSAMNAANEGDAADVPPISAGRPPRKIRKDSDCAATSGIACFNLK